MTEFETVWVNDRVYPYHKYAPSHVVIMRNETQPPFILAGATSESDAIAKMKLCYAALDVPGLLSVYTYDPLGQWQARYVSWIDSVNPKSWAQGQRTVRELAAYLTANAVAGQRVAKGPFVADGNYFIASGGPGDFTIFKYFEFDNQTSGDPTPDGLADNGDDGGFTTKPYLGPPGNHNVNSNRQRLLWKHRAVPNGITSDVLAWSPKHGPQFTVELATIYPDVPTVVQAVDIREETPIMSTPYPFGCRFSERAGGYPEPFGGVASVPGNIGGPGSSDPFSFTDTWFPIQYWPIYGDRSSFGFETRADDGSFQFFNIGMKVDDPEIVQDGTIQYGYNQNCDWEYYGTIWQLQSGYWWHRFCTSVTISNGTNTLVNYIGISQADFDVWYAAFGSPGYVITDFAYDEEYGLLSANHVGENLDNGRGQEAFNLQIPAGGYHESVHVNQWDFDVWIAYPTFAIKACYGFSDSNENFTFRYSSPIIASFTYMLGHTPSTQPTPPPASPGETQSTIPIKLAIGGADVPLDNPFVPSATQCGTLTDGRKVYTNWQTRYAEVPSFYPTSDVPAGQVCLGYISVDSEAQPGTDVTEVLWEQPILVNGPATYHLWTGPADKAPANPAGTIVHTSTPTGLPVPVTSYPFYSEPHTVTI